MLSYSSPVASTAGGNDMFCQSHQVVNAGRYITMFSMQILFYIQVKQLIFTHNNRCATAERNEPDANGWDLNPFDRR
jgi:hypothetical protein